MIKYCRLVFLIIITTSCQAQAPWQMNVGTVGKIPGFHIFETYDKGLIILAADYGVQHYYLIKTDANGKVIYERRVKYENPSGSQLSFASIARVSSTKDGGILLCGSVSPNDTFNNAFVAKLDACGDIIWSYILDDNISLTDGTYLNTASEINDKLFLLMGQFMGYNIMLTINDSGSIRSQSSINSTLASLETIKTNSGCFLTNGGKYTLSNTDTTKGYLRSMLINADQQGQLKWYNTYGLSDDSASMALYISEYDNKRGDIYVQGIHSNPIKKSFNLSYLKKCDSMGQQIWHKNMGQQLLGKGQYIEHPRGIIKLKDDNLLLLESRDFDLYYRLSFARMIKLNPNGDVIDSATLGDSANFYTLTGATQTYDSNIVVAYSYYKTNHYNGYIQLRKFDYNMKQVNMDTTNYKYDSLCPHAVRTDDIDLSNSKTIPFILDTSRIFKERKYYKTVNAIPTIEGRPQLKIWPNPFDTWLKVSMPPGNDITTAEMHDLTGKLIWNGRVYTNGMIETGQLPQGIYILSIYNRSGDRWDAKVVKQ